MSLIYETCSSPAFSNTPYQSRNGAWRHSDPNRMCVFLGDFIDRGPNNAEVISIVRNMMDAGVALAVMGNHELNAIHFHTQDPETGQFLRPRSAKNIQQHQSFLDEFPIGDPSTKSALDWMRGLPLFLELDGFRAVHACWSEQKIEALKGCTNAGVLSDEQFVFAGREDSELFKLVDTTAKGPEIDLPDEYSFQDKNGAVRSKVRAKWWRENAKSWRDVAISVPDISMLPDGDIPEGTSLELYAKEAVSVFFGHYWLDGDVALQAPNALCLDYSAGTTGPLATYVFEKGDLTIRQSDVKLHSK